MFDVHTPRPAIHPWHAVRGQGGCRRTGRRERAVGAVVHPPDPAPGRAGSKTQPVGVSEPSNISLVHGHGGHPQPAGGP